MRNKKLTIHNIDKISNITNKKWIVKKIVQKENEYIILLIVNPDFKFPTYTTECIINRIQRNGIWEIHLRGWGSVQLITTDPLSTPEGLEFIIDSLMT